MRKIVMAVIIFTIVLLAESKVVEARLLPRFQNVRSTGRGDAVSGLTVSPCLRADRRALIVTFSNLQKVNSVFYTLMYQTNGKDEGVSGTLTSSVGNSVTRELLFGTCSSGVCRYHQNITSMKFEVTSELISGKRTVKRFRVKI